MTREMFRAFVKEALALQMEDENTPPTYVATKAAVMQKLGMSMGGLSMGMSAPKPPSLHAIGSSGVKAGSGMSTAFKPQNPIKPITPQNTLLKTASVGRHALELAGLGTLAAPAVQELRGKHVEDKTKQKAEVAGLGMLAAPYAHDLAHAGSGTYRKATGAIANSRVGRRLSILGKSLGH